MNKIDNIAKLREIGWDCIRASNYLRYVRRENEINKEHIDRYNESLRKKSGKVKSQTKAELRKEIDRLKNLLKVNKKEI